MQPSFIQYAKDEAELTKGRIADQQKLYRVWGLLQPQLGISSPANRLTFRQIASLRWPAKMCPQWFKMEASAST